MSEWPVVQMGDVAAINPEATAGFRGDRQIRYIDIAAISRERGIEPGSIREYTYSDAPGRARRVVRTGDVLVSTVRPGLRAFGRVTPDLDGEVASTGVAVLRATEAALPGFIWAVVTTDAFADDMVSRATGSNYPAVRAADVAAHTLRLPPLDVQRRIVDLVGALDANIAALDEETTSVLHLYLQLIARQMSSDGNSATLLGDCMSLERHRESTDDEETYRVAGVLRSGEGLIDKGLMRGSATTYTSLYRLRPGQLIMRKLTAWEGPITVVPDEYDGFVASSEFPTFNIDDDRLLPEFMRHVCRWPGLWHEMKQRLTGSVQRRKRLNPEQLLSILLSLPSVEAQGRAAGLLESLEEHTERLRAEADALRAVRAAILPALLSGDVEIPESYDELVGVA